MSCTLVNITGELDAILCNLGIKRQLDWPVPELLHQLDECGTPQGLQQWHAQILRNVVWIRPQSAPLNDLCSRVLVFLERTVEKAGQLRRWIAGKEGPPDGVDTHRHLVMLALNDIRGAFEEFSVAASNAEFIRPHVEAIVLEYNRKTYYLMVTLAQLLFPPEVGNGTYIISKQYLAMTWLTEVEFNALVPRLENSTNPGVILDRQVTPTTMIPAHPYPPPEKPTNPGMILDHQAVPETMMPARPLGPCFTMGNVYYEPALLQNGQDPHGLDTVDQNLVKQSCLEPSVVEQNFVDQNRGSEDYNWAPNM